MSDDYKVSGETLGTKRDRLQVDWPPIKPGTLRVSGITVPESGYDFVTGVIYGSVHARKGVKVSYTCCASGIINEMVTAVCSLCGRKNRTQKTTIIMHDPHDRPYVNVVSACYACRYCHCPHAWVERTKTWEVMRPGGCRYSDD